MNWPEGSRPPGQCRFLVGPSRDRGDTFLDPSCVLGNPIVVGAGDLELVIVEHCNLDEMSIVIDNAASVLGLD